MEDSVNIEQWIVVNTAGGRYLGRPVYEPDDELSTDMKEAVIQIISNGDVLELHDALDFMSPLRPVQVPGGGMAFTRDPIVVSPDFTTSPIPVYVKPASVYFCEDLSAADQKLYLEFIQRAQQQALQERAGRSGLSLASSRG